MADSAHLTGRPFLFPCPPGHVPAGRSLCPSVCEELAAFDLMSCVPPNPSSLPTEVDITPNDDGLPGIAQLRNIVGAMMTIGLILSVLALIISAIV